MIGFVAGVLATLALWRAAERFWERWRSRVQPLYERPKTDIKGVSYW